MNSLQDHSAESRIAHAVDRWQARACECCHLPPARIIDRIRALADEFPVNPSVIERVVIRNLLSRVLSQAARSLASTGRADVSAPFMAWTASSFTSTAWRDDVSRLLDAWSEAFGRTHQSSDAHQDSRLHRATRFLDEHFSRSSVSLVELASAIDLSKCHASRFLRRATGRGFTAHVHGRRIAKAQGLLRTTLSSVKEIAFAVGYVDCSQLGRYFKRLTSMTPCEYRSTAAARSRDKSQ